MPTSVYEHADLLVNLLAGGILCFLAAIAYYLKDMASAIKGLTKSLSEHKVEVAKEYVSKDDCKDIRANCPIHQVLR